MDKSSEVVSEPVNKTQLMDKRRNELEELAGSLGVNNPNTIRNKDQLILAILEQQEMVTADKEKLTPKQEEFCRLYASDREFFGNGTQAYVEAYNINLASEGAYIASAASASRLLKNAKVLERINEYLSEVALNDAHVDKQMAFVITQNADLNAKNQAIKEYNRVKKRVEAKLPEGNTYNLTQNNYRFNTPEGKDLTQSYLNYVLEETKGKLVGKPLERSQNAQEAS